MVRLFPFPEIRVTLLPPVKAKRVAGLLKSIISVILLVDKILIAPFPFVYHALRPDQKLSARALSMSFLIVGFTFLPEMFDNADMDLMWKYKLPIEVSLFLGYFMARVGWHEVGALLTALVLTVEYHYSVSLLPKVYTSVVQLSGLFVPFMLLVITNHWIIVLLFYFTNVFLFIYYVHTYPPESGIQLEINLIAVVISMMLYSSCAHNFNHWQLKQNEQRYVQFFRENFEAIAVVDWQGVVREVNQSFSELFSSSRGENLPIDFVDRSIFEFIDVDQRSQVARMFLMQTETISIGDNLPRIEVNGLRIDGQVIRVQVGLKMLRDFHGFSSTNAPIMHDSEVIDYGKALKKSTVFMMSFHDLTAHQQAQAALVEAEREKHANDAKSKFLANMSHEIRTPLNGVLGMLQLLEDTPLNKEQRLFLKNSVDSANYLLLLINDILDFSKIEAGLLPIDEYEYRLSDCIESVVDLLHANARTKNIDLYAFIHPRCPVTVLGDAARLRQVLMNLVSNAIKFTSKGKVLVQCDVDTSGDELPPDSIRLRFQVLDTGIGLKPESIDRLFQRFYQVDDTALRRNHGGTGLGLAISRNLVGLMGGEIGVNSKFGEGSTFWFTLTCKRAHFTPQVKRQSSIQNLPLIPQPSQNVRALDTPHKKIQHQLHTQIQKEMQYQLHQQVSAARSYTDMPAMSYVDGFRAYSDVSVHPLQSTLSFPELPVTPLSSPPSIRATRSNRSSTTLAGSTIYQLSQSSLPYSNGMERVSLVPVSIIAISDSSHTRNILGEYFRVWGYNEVSMFKSLSEGLPHIYNHQEDGANDKKLIIILCIKNTQLDNATQECVVEIKTKYPSEEFPLFVLFIDKGYVKVSLPKEILPQATLCFPIRQSQLYQVLIEARDPSRRFASRSPLLKNKEKPVSAMPRVLYVDSSPTSRLMMKQTLQADGIMCDTAPTKRDALSTLFTPTSPPPVNNSKFPYDIVLIDVTSPSEDVNGYECTKEIRNLEQQNFSGGRVPIIGVSADAATTLAKCIESGMDGLCNLALPPPTPFAEHLRATIHQWLQHTPRLSLSFAASTDEPKDSGATITDAAAAKAAHIKSGEPLSGQKILVVEDNAMNQVVVSTFLKKAGYTYDFASDGQQAVDMYDDNPFAYRLILMDCQMPVMDGYEASIRIRQKESSLQIRHIPIVAMTAAALVVDRERCLAVGMSDFVQKPIQRPLFLEILAKWLQHKRE